MTGQDYPTTQEYRYIEFTAANSTTLLWQPRINISGATNRVTLTGINYSTNVPSSVVIYVGTNSTGPQKIVMLMAGSSASVSPFIGPIRSTMTIGGNLYATVGNASSAGAGLLVTGYEEE